MPIRVRFDSLVSGRGVVVSDDWIDGHTGQPVTEQRRHIGGDVEHVMSRGLPGVVGGRVARPQHVRQLALWGYSIRHGLNTHES